jgi:hypothetical protein
MPAQIFLTRQQIETIATLEHDVVVLEGPSEATRSTAGSWTTKRSGRARTDRSSSAATGLSSATPSSTTRTHIRFAPRKSPRAADGGGRAGHAARRVTTTPGNA